MGKKTFAIFGIFAVLLLSLGLTSAYYTSDNDVTLTTYVNALTDVSEGQTYDLEATIENLNDTDYYVVFGGYNQVWDDDEINVTNGTTRNFTGILTIPASAGSRSIIANFYSTTNNSELLFQLSKSITLTYAEEEEEEEEEEVDTETFCELDNFGTERGHLEIEVDVRNNGAGDDEEWQYLDEIVIEVTVENTDNDNINDVMVELMILDDRGNTISRKKMGLDQDDEDLGRIKDDDEETATFTIDELPIDLDEGDYFLYIRAYEEDNEANECVSKADDFTNDAETYFEFSIESSDDATVIVKRKLPNVKASCGDENVEVRFMVYNTGSDDEDEVLVTLENSKLGIYETFLMDGLRDGKGKEATFYIDIPAEIENMNSQKLKIYTYYDYDDDEDELDENAYGESSEDEGDDFYVGLEILSCAVTAPTVTASLGSTMEIGQNLVVRATITNNGNDNEFIIAPMNFDSWADLVSTVPGKVTIASGASQEVVITLSPKESGTQTFVITTVVDGETFNQPVSVKITKGPGIFSALGLSNTMGYLITGIVALLVIIFLVLIIKVARKPIKADF